MEAILIGISLGVYLSGIIITGAVIYYGIEINEIDSFIDAPILYIFGCVFWPALWVAGFFLVSIRWLGKKFVAAQKMTDAKKEEAAE